MADMQQSGKADKWCAEKRAEEWIEGGNRQDHITDISALHSSIDLACLYITSFIHLHPSYLAVISSNISPHFQPKMSSTVTLTKPHSRAVQAGRVDHSIYPPVEFFHTIDGVIRSHAAETEQKPFICYPVKGASDFEEHTPAEVDRYVDLAARYYVDHGLEPAVSLQEERSRISWIIAN